MRPPESAKTVAMTTNLGHLDNMLVAYLEDAREIRVPLEWFPRLRDATDQERAEFRLIGQGVGIHWPQLDEDLSVAGLLAPEASARVRKVG